MKPVLEKIENNPYSISAYHYKKAGFEAPWHFHPQFEMVYIVEGKGTRYVGNSIEPFEEGDFVIIAKNVPHCWKDAKDYSGNCHSIVVQWMESTLELLPEYNQLSQWLHYAYQGIRFQPMVARKYKHQMEQIVTDSPIARLATFLTLLDKLKNEDLYKLLCNTREEYKLSVTTNDRLNKVYQFIENNYYKKITLSEIAGMINMTSESFSRFFSKTMKKPFFSFLNEYRINKACNLLVETNRSISEICFVCGFDSLPFFHKQFKQYKEITPLQYRKEFLKTENGGW